MDKNIKVQNMELSYIIVNKYNKEKMLYKYTNFNINEIDKDDIIFNRYELINKLCNEV